MNTLLVVLKWEVVLVAVFFALAFLLRILAKICQKRGDWWKPREAAVGKGHRAYRWITCAFECELNANGASKLGWLCSMVCVLTVAVFLISR